MKPKTNISPLPPVEEIQNDEQVRIYRLHILEENQVKILKKIEELEDTLDEKYNTKIEEHEKRIDIIESRNKLVNYICGAVFIEGLAILGFIIKAWLGV